MRPGWRRQNRLAAAEAALTDHQRLAIGLVALGNQERMLALEIMAERAASRPSPSRRCCATPKLSAKAEDGGRLGYQRGAEAALAFPFSFAAAYFFYRRFEDGSLADRLGDRFEMLLVTRLLIQELAGARAVQMRSIFGERVVELIDVILKVRLKRTTAALDALRRQYPQYAAALEARFLRQSAMRREMGRYDALFQRKVSSRPRSTRTSRAASRTRKREARPRFDLGLDTRELIGRLDLFADLNDQQLERVQKLLKARFAVPRELIVREGDEGDACYFIASGAAEVVFPGRRIPLGSGDLFGEMALLTGMTRQADVVAMTYCRLLVLRKVDFDRFMEDNRDIRLAIHKIAATRSSMNRSDETRAGLA